MVVDQLKTLGLPSHISSLMNEIPWNERLSHPENISQSSKLIFISEGLSLSAKESIESFLKPYLDGKTLYFQKAIINEATPRTAPQKPTSTPTLSQTPYKIIAVSSGKGGVGKSTVSTNLALGLQQQGYKVGLLDADIYGPSIPTFFGISEDPQVNEETNKIIPLEKFGIKLMSFGFFTSPDVAVIWRGPMVMKALQQFFFQVEWGDIDFLILDLPPGTGDTQITIIQSVTLAGVIVVTTPQEVAISDVLRNISLFKKMNIPVLGIIENMSFFENPESKEKIYLFGKDGGLELSKKLDLPFIGQIPLIQGLREISDHGISLMQDINHPARGIFLDLAANVVGRLGSSPQEMTN